MTTTPSETPSQNISPDVTPPVVDTQVNTPASETTVQTPEYNAAADNIVFAFTKYQRYIQAKEAGNEELAKTYIAEAGKLLFSAMRSQGIVDLVKSLNQINTAAVTASLPEELEEDEGIDAPDIDTLDFSDFDLDDDEADLGDDQDSDDDKDEDKDEDTDESEEEGEYASVATELPEEVRANLSLMNTLSLSGTEEAVRVAKRLKA